MMETPSLLPFDQLDSEEQLGVQDIMDHLLKRVVDDVEQGDTIDAIIDLANNAGVPPEELDDMEILQAVMQVQQKNIPTRTQTPILTQLQSEPSSSPSLKRKYKLANGASYEGIMYPLAGIEKINMVYKSRPILVKATRVGVAKKTKYSYVARFVFETDDERIDAEAWGDEAVKFAGTLVKGEVYMINNYGAVVSNPEYCETKGHFSARLLTGTTCILMDKTSLLSVKTLPTVVFTYTNKLYLHVDKTVDLCCAVIAVGLPFNVTTEALRTTSCLNVTVADDMGFAVDLTLWSEAAEDFPDISNFPKLATIRGIVQINNSGLTVKIQSLDDFEWQPVDCTRVRLMKKWLQHGIRRHGLQSLSTPKNLNTDTPHPKRPVWPINAMVIHANSKMLPYSFTIVGMFTEIHETKDPIIYRSCPVDDSKLALYDPNQPATYCQKCGVHIYDCHYSFYMIVRIADYSGGTTVKMFNRGGEALFGMPCAAIGQMYEKNRAKFDQTVKSMMFKHFTMQVQLHINDNKGSLNVQGLVVDMCDTNMTNYATDAQFSIHDMLVLPNIQKPKVVRVE